MLPLASKSDIGGVKIGDGLTIDADGMLKLDAAVVARQERFATYVSGKLAEISMPATLESWLATDACVLPSSLPGSMATLRTAPNRGDVVLKLWLNDGVNSPLGTITFKSGSKSGQISFSKDAALNAGDVLSLAFDRQIAADDAAADLVVILQARLR